MVFTLKCLISLNFLIALSRLSVLQPVESQVTGSQGDKGY